ncbi:hypothetical protein CEXT_291011 [Caerostris extrusa]|uniref:Uncharacterized protein n=1 Tax=Caerostris extrusa TaxID=172846 RepID=A0AAV4NRE0_CAEEX|nr:hypothetical protein CEXT_291011 [Caerostris extrusa]
MPETGVEIVAIDFGFPSSSSSFSSSRLFPYLFSYFSYFFFPSNLILVPHPLPAPSRKAPVCQKHANKSTRQSITKSFSIVKVLKTKRIIESRRFPTLGRNEVDRLTTLLKA